ncbi:MAG: hypothetical protein JHC93_08240 [Parachlamydiales bacterium]|nr:hypothetical protein [Parachlamydiales bacterium]
MCNSINAIEGIDPFHYLHNDILQSNIIPKIVFEPKNNSVFMVSKKWNETLKQAKVWKNLAENYSFIRKEDKTLFLTEPKKAYFLNERIKTAILDDSYDMIKDKFTEGRILRYGILGEDLIMQNSRSSPTLTFELNKFNKDSSSYTNMYQNIKAFATSGNTLFYLTKEFELYKQEKNAPAVLLHNDIAKLVNGERCDSEIDVSKSEIVLLNDKCVCKTKLYSEWLHVIDESGNKLSKKLPQITALTTFNNTLVTGTFDGKISFYDENLDLIKCLESEPNNQTQSNTSILAFVNFQGKLVSGGMNQTIKIWSDNDDYSELSPKVTISCLGALDNRLVSSSDEGTISIWKKDKTCHTVKVPLTGGGSFLTTHENIIYFRGHILVFDKKKSQKSN